MKLSLVLLVTASCFWASHEVSLLLKNLGDQKHRKRNEEAMKP